MVLPIRDYLVQGDKIKNKYLNVFKEPNIIRPKFPINRYKSLIITPSLLNLKK